MNAAAEAPTIQRHDRATVNRSTPDPPQGSTRFLQMIPRDFSRAHLICSMGQIDGVEHLLVGAKSDPAAIHNVGVALECEISVLVTDDDESLAHLIDAEYERAASEAPADISADVHSSSNQGEIDLLLAEADRDLLSVTGKGPVVRLVDALLFEALGRCASDVHVQPQSNLTHIRYRLDGVLHTVRQMPRQVTPAVVSRIKVMGRMDIAERRVPQDGRATVTIGQRNIDLRISTMPTSHGERAVLRLLDNSQGIADLDQLGMPQTVQTKFLSCAARTSGIILVTGPTGSGKTTTLYATLRRTASSQVNIMTIEDPIEYDLSAPGLTISQSQINPKKGVNFATGLRHILRQDPDVIMVGEIRDAETARIAIQSSLTGHLVLSTLHTNDAPSAVARLIDLGIEPYLASASLSAVLAQRLVRLLHRDCDGKGCPDCLNSGFRGRTGIYELLLADESLRGLIAAGASLQELQRQARSAGMRTLWQEGQELVLQRRTSASEIERVIGADA